MRSSEYFIEEFSHVCKNNDMNKLKHFFETEPDKNLLLMYSAIHGNLNFIIYLVKNDVDLHCEDNYVFDISCNYNYPDITRYFILESLDLCYWINKAFVIYTHIGNMEFVDELLKMGADVSYMNNDAIIFAANAEMVKYLFDNGVDIVATYDDILRIAIQDKKTDIVKYLQSLGF